MKSQIENLLDNAVAYVRSQIDWTASIGIVLGTGFGGVANSIDVRFDIPFSDIPDFPQPTVDFHKGRILCGFLHGVPVIALQGRLHYYEGFSMSELTLPVRVLSRMGVTTLLISNACGSMNPHFKKGDVMIIDDHINLMGDNPLRGPNLDSCGPRFPDMSEPYSQKFIALAEKCALERGINLKKGVYAAYNGPSLETRAEYRFLRIIGADVVGMSTVPETIVARHMGMNVVGLSLITDECLADNLRAVSIDDILAVVSQREPVLTTLIESLVQEIHDYLERATQ